MQFLGCLGARRQILDSYISRIKELEDTGLSYPGVVKSYLIPGGRELRVVVESEKVSDSLLKQINYLFKFLKKYKTT